MDNKLFDKDFKDILSIRYQTDNTNILFPTNHLSKIDPLTRVYCREYFNTQLSIQWQDAAYEKTSIALFIIDVDDFKSFNKSCDTRSGDYALQKIAKCLKLLFRRSTDLVARNIGDQFIILVLGMGAIEAELYEKTIKERIKNLKIYNHLKKEYLAVSIQHVVHHPKKKSSPAIFLNRLLDDFAKRLPSEHLTEQVDRLTSIHAVKNIESATIGESPLIL
jgi:diguanylate cyclase (GGDEF)-like protein